MTYGAMVPPYARCLTEQDAPDGYDVCSVPFGDRTNPFQAI